MNIIEKKIADIRPYENNPRKNDDAVKYVAESIKHFGFKVPIIIDRSNIIVAGHTRYKAAKKVGLSVIPCVVADDLSNEQIKAFRLADNKVAEKAGWDFDLLSDELGDLFDFDMSVFGFDEKEIDFDQNDLDAETDVREIYAINIRFDNHTDFERCKTNIEPIVDEFGGRLSVRME